MSALDPATLTSSAQAFSAPNATLPQLRALHKTLLAQADDKAARLRTRVGASYRELLGTADTIVRMRADADAAQAVLARAGTRCSRTAVAAKAKGLNRFVTEGEDGYGYGYGHGYGYGYRHGHGVTRGAGNKPRADVVGAEAIVDGQVEAGADLGLVARARLLDACVLALGRVLRGGGYDLGNTSAKEEAKGGKEKEDKTTTTTTTTTTTGCGERLLVGAKVLLLSRLLAASFGEGSAAVEDGGIGKAVEATKKSLLSLRRRLVRSINRVLEDVGEPTQLADVAKALSAYSLATSSGTRDVLRHFLAVRKEAMARLAFEAQDSPQVHTAEEVLRALRLYAKTLLHVQSLVPYRLTEALAALKKDALLADETLSGIEGLRLDVYKRWCGDEIQYFTPFIRHDDLDGQQAKDMLASWAREGSTMLLQGLGKVLEVTTEFRSIVQMRTDLLELWIAEGGKLRGFDPSVLLDQFRDVINKRMLEVLEAKVAKLRLVGSEVAATLEAWQEGVTDKHQGLWDGFAFDADLSRGAAQFTQEVVARLYGRNDAVSRALARYKAWYGIIDDVGAVVDHLRRQRWDIDVDDVVEDEETIELRRQALSRDDPRRLDEQLNASLVTAFGALDEYLESLWRTALSEGKPGRPGGAVAMYLVRVIRDVRAQLPDLESVKEFGLGVVPSLHEAVSAAVVASPLEYFSTTALTRRRVVGRGLWEGAPELPTAPSPGVFRFLRNLTVAMGDAGTDLWSPAAVSVLRRHVVKGLSQPWREALAARLAETSETTAEGQDGASGEEEPAVDGDSNANGQESERKGKEGVRTDVATAEQRRDLFVQWLFDISYLYCFLAASPSDTRQDDGLRSLEKVVCDNAGLEGTEVRKRVTETAQEYWKKTSLLFGLLA